jgi:hypothetical protein
MVTVMVIDSHTFVQIEKHQRNPAMVFNVQLVLQHSELTDMKKKTMRRVQGYE